ncbi:MAG: SseB family protein [Clostridia bacterium]|nr:SseB family protein [Clostridia bacterium]
MYCHKCGKSIMDNSKFCWACGAPVLPVQRNVQYPKEPTVLYCKRAFLYAEKDSKTDALYNLFSLLYKSDVFVPFRSQLRDSDIEYLKNIKEGDSVTDKIENCNKPDIMSTPDGKLFFPMFTHKMQIPDAYRRKYSIMSLEYTRALQIAESMPELSGIVFDPFNEPLSLTFDIVQIGKKYINEIKEESNPVDVPDTDETDNSDILRGIELMKSCNMLYVIYNDSMGARFPAIDKTGNAWVFTQFEYAEAVVEKNTGIGLAVKAFPKEEFNGYVKSWYAFGIEKFALNIGTDKSEIIVLDDYTEIVSDSPYTGCKLNLLIIRYKQLLSIGNNEGAVSAAESVWNDFCKQLDKNVFLVPVCYDGDPAYVEDTCLHVSQRAAEIIAENYSGEIKFLGGEKYHFADEKYLSENGEKLMHIKTVCSNGKAFIPAFTEINSIHAIFTDKVRIGIFTYEEIFAHLSSSVVGFDGEIDGIVFNPGSTNLVLMRDDMTKVEKNRKQNCNNDIPVEA